jgi:hypothetical protein
LLFEGFSEGREENEENKGERTGREEERERAGEEERNK